MSTETSTSLPMTPRRKWIRALQELLQHAVLQDRVIKRIYPGIMHLLIFWGMTIQVLGTIINLLQYPLFLPVEIAFPRGQAYLVFELVMDLGGAMILVGVIMALARRAFFRPSHLPNRWEDWYALALLFTLTVVGFASEAIRLQAADPAWRAWSFLGDGLARGLAAIGLRVTTDALIHKVLFWSHAGLGLLFFASLPFTKLRHLLTGPLNIVIRPQRPLGALEVIEDLETAESLGAGEIEAYPSQALVSFDACVQCGRCEEVCPATYSGMPYSPRALIYALQRSMHETLMGEDGTDERSLLEGFIDKETPWLCTTCGACLYACPLFIDPVSSVLELRRYLTLTTGEVPGSVGETLMQMERRGNPWGLPKEEHAPWAREMGVRVIQPGESTDVLLFLGCAYGYDSRNQKAGRALVGLLQQAGVDFAILGAAEGCCGETGRRMGHEYVFQVMVEENLAIFQAVEFKRLVTPCAHCFNSLKNEYPQFGADFVVQHHSELLAELAAAGKLPAAEAGSAPKATYHDPCYLGRYNTIFEAPRMALNGSRGLELREMQRSRAESFCCGGGGGHMWMETDPNTRINQKRLEQAMQETGAEVVVTACPYCLIMFEDAIRSKGVGEQVQAKDIAEVLAEGQEAD